MRKQSIRKTTRKGIAAILAAAMLTVLLPLGVFAAEGDFGLLPVPQTDYAERAAEREARHEAQQEREIPAAREPLRSGETEFEAKTPLDAPPAPYVYIKDDNDIVSEVPFSATGAAAQGDGWSWSAANKTLTVTKSLKAAAFFADADDSATVAYSGNITIVAVNSEYINLTVKGTGKTGSILTTEHIYTTHGKALTIQDAKIEIKSLVGGYDEIVAWGTGSLLMVNNCTLTFYGDLIGSYYLYSDGAAVVTDSVISSAGYEAVIEAHGNLSISGCDISFTGNASCFYADSGGDLSVADTVVSFTGDGSYFGVNGGGDLNISGNSTITLTKTYSEIYNENGNLSISGGSIVNISGGNADVYSKHGDLTIAGGSKINISGANAEVYSDDGSLSISGGSEVLSTGNYTDVYSEDGNLSIAGGSTVSLSGYESEIYSEVGNLSIAGSSTVSAHSIYSGDGNLTIAGGSAVSISGSYSTIKSANGDLSISGFSTVSATGSNVRISAQVGSLSIAGGSELRAVGDFTQIAAAGGTFSIAEKSVLSIDGNDAMVVAASGSFHITDGKVTLTGNMAQMYALGGDVLIDGKSKVYVRRFLGAQGGKLILNLAPGGRVEVGAEGADGGAFPATPGISVLNATNEKALILGDKVKVVTPADGKIDVYYESGTSLYNTAVLTGNYSGGVTNANLAYHVVIENPVALRPGWNPFIDVTSDAWYYNNIKFIYENRIFAGTSDTTFEPSTPMTRAMLVQVLYSYEGKPAPTNLSGFSDVPTDAYYANAVAWALENGIVSGIGDNQFGSDRAVSRQDFTLILAKYAVFLYVKLPTVRPYTAFTDQDSIANYAKAAVEAAYKAKIISGKDGGKFDPTSGATRAEVAAMLHQFVLIADA
jgi:hypothetical protein